VIEQDPCCSVEGLFSSRLRGFAWKLFNAAFHVPPGKAFTTENTGNTERKKVKEFDDNPVVNKKVNTIAAIHVRTAIMYGDSVLLFDSKFKSTLWSLCSLW
jgi:hypothetical protein